MSKQTFNIENKTIFAYNVQPAAPTFYAFVDQEAQADELAFRLPEYNVVALMEPNWEQSFTPWAAPKLYKKAADFGGGAAAYHAWFTQTLVAEVEQRMGWQPQWRALLGYSLAGLFALYAAYEMPYFQRVACVSGSLWFDGWTDFAASHTPKTLPAAMYFSLGEQEANSKNARLAQVQAAMEHTVAQWQAYGVPLRYEINAGGHFDDVAERLAKAARWLAEAA